jgi:hypothetical protein
MFPVRYELDFYILFRRNLVSKGLKRSHLTELLFTLISNSVTDQNVSY